MLYQRAPFPSCITLGCTLCEFWMVVGHRNFFLTSPYPGLVSLPFDLFFRKKLQGSTTPFFQEQAKALLDTPSPFFP